MAHPQRRINTIPHGAPQAKQPTEQWCTKIMQNIFLSYHCPKSKLKLTMQHFPIQLSDCTVSMWQSQGQRPGLSFSPLNSCIKFVIRHWSQTMPLQNEMLISQFERINQMILNMHNSFPSTEPQMGSLLQMIRRRH